MSQHKSVNHEYVEYIPAKLQSGVLYISLKYNTASHLCCCGCGNKVVTPLNAAKWSLIDHGKSVSLYPSIGNWSFPCKSHYWISQGRIKWADVMSNQQIADVRKRDINDVILHSSNGNSTSIFLKILIWVKKWF